MFKDIEFRKALQELPEKEKDKLILRLLRRDMDLAEKLYFELVDTDSVEDKRKLIENEISKTINAVSQRNYNLDSIAGEMRYISGSISHHVKITKDKFGEITLNLQMLIEVLTLNRMYIVATKPNNCIKFFTYFIQIIHLPLI